MQFPGLSLKWEKVATLLWKPLMRLLRACEYSIAKASLISDRHWVKASRRHFAIHKSSRNTSRNGLENLVDASQNLNHPKKLKLSSENDCCFGGQSFTQARFLFSASRPVA